MEFDSSEKQADTKPTTITLRNNGDLVEGTIVRITIDAHGEFGIGGSQKTNQHGKVIFQLVDGATYYIWASKDGMNLPRGVQFKAEAD